MGRFTSQGQAEDLVLWHRYNYYVLGCALISDGEYDDLEAAVRDQWSVCVCGVGGTVGSSRAEDYTRYIIEGRRPNEIERWLRDTRIADRWMEHL